MFKRKLPKVDARNLAPKWAIWRPTLKRLDDTLASCKAKTQCNSLGDVKTKALACLLADKVAEKEVETLGDKVNTVSLDYGLNCKRPRPKHLGTKHAFAGLSTDCDSG